MKNLLIMCGIVALIMYVHPAICHAQPVGVANYNWSHVAIGGGGYVTGVVIHPTQPDLIYMRTDVGGCYRWDSSGQRWIQLLGALGQAQGNLYGVEALAIDPSNPDVVYVAAGKYDKHSVIRGQRWRLTDPPPCDVLKSTDRGRTWHRTGLDVDMAANTMGRKLTQPLAVDPHDGRVVYYGSGWDGLWRSTRGAESGSWRRVISFPRFGAEGKGIVCVAFDASSGAPGQPTPVIYAGAWNDGIYRSDDAGATWSHLAGGPLRPFKARVDTAGTLFVTHESGVMKYADGKWHDISPVPSKFVALDVSPTKPGVVLTATRQGRYWEALYYSTDSGEHWRKLTCKAQTTVPWWPPSFFACAVASVAMNPHNPGEAWLTGWFGIWRTSDMSARKVQWTNLEQGHEEICTLDLISPPAGAPLFSGVFDVGGFRHGKLDQFPTKMFGSTIMKDSTSLDYCATDPDVLARVGGNQSIAKGGGFYSHDNGQTWTAFANKPPDAIGGRVAVSASDPNVVVWFPFKSDPYASHDGGKLWTRGVGISGDLVRSYWAWDKPLASDRVIGNRFYIYSDKTGQLMRSDDGGMHWRSVGLLPPVGSRWHGIVTPPGTPDHIWAYLADEGLYLSRDGGESFTAIPQVSDAILLAFGKAPKGSDLPAVFLFGRVNHSEWGLFRSGDYGRSWMTISQPGHSLGNEPTVLAGDLHEFGRVYVGTNGSGIAVGTPLVSNAPHDSRHLK